MLVATPVDPVAPLKRVAVIEKLVSSLKTSTKPFRSTTGRILKS
uniref:Alternative protein KRT34 n=1 Tax=Homo sapiens TaxID=9606 RepID=L0R6J1_HUMAN|nr:alternative protein KRT34 [Homo sapiens]